MPLRVVQSCRIGLRSSSSTLNHHARPLTTLQSRTLQTSLTSTPPVSSGQSFGGARTATTVSTPRFVKIVECGVRDGLQNEPNTVSVETKLELLERLANAGLRAIESGAMVSKKAVPQMATTAEVLRGLKPHTGVAYPVLVPNVKGLENLLQLLKSIKEGDGGREAVDEIAIFTAASDSFNKANTNKSVADSLIELEKVTQLALDYKLRVRGYVSTVITCPFEGKVRPKRVKEVGKALLDMGCYEVSLRDTVGTGTSETVTALMDEVAIALPMNKIAVHNHDTYGMAVANVLTALKYGVRTVDSSVAGLGGCPFSPGATGNAATEDLVHALHGAGYETGVDLQKLVATGEWISEVLGRRNESRAGRGWSARWRREETKKAA